MELPKGLPWIRHTSSSNHSIAMQPIAFLLKYERTQGGNPLGGRLLQSLKSWSHTWNSHTLTLRNLATRNSHTDVRGHIASFHNFTHQQLAMLLNRGGGKFLTGGIIFSQRGNNRRNPIFRREKTRHNSQKSCYLANWAAAVKETRNWEVSGPHGREKILLL